MARNLKLWNHWIAEVREIALGIVYHSESEDDDGNVKMMTKSDLKWSFDKANMLGYFNDGLTPQEAFELEVSTWEH